MLPHWKRLTLEQRMEIAHGLAHDEPLKSIAQRIGMDPTSVSKEIKRNRTTTAAGSGECRRLGRFPFVCDNCVKKYGRAKCGCAKFRYDAKAAQAMAIRHKKRKAIYNRAFLQGNDDVPGGEAAYVSDLNAIFGHFLVVYYALTVMRLLELKTFGDELPIEQLFDFICGYNVTETREGGFVNNVIDTLTYRTIKEKMGLTKLGNFYLSKKDLDNLFKIEL